MDVLRKVISLLILAAVMLAACASQDSDNNIPATDPAMTEAGTAAPSPEPAQNSTAGNSTADPNHPVEIIPITGDLNPARLSNLLDFEVLNQAGEQIGEVHDIIMDLDVSGVVYVVVNTGGLLNVGERQVAVPWSALQVHANTDNSPSTAQSFFTLVVDQELFMNAPTISVEKDLPEMGQHADDWDSAIRAYWNLGIGPGTAPSVTAPPPGPGQPSGTHPTPTPEGLPLSGIILASEALGFDFKLQGEEALNVSIDDMIINIQTGKILYVVIHTNFENAREQWTPIPYSMLKWDLPNRAYLLNVDMVTLQSAPFYIDNLYPDTTRPGWDDIYVYFWKEHGLTTRP